MTEILINPAKTCAFSGHRNMKYGIDKSAVEEIILSLIKDGYNTFLVGMAVGFDTLAFNILEKIRESENIKIIACIPCENQNKHFNEEQNKEYLRALSSADQKILLSKEYTPYAMIKRNRFMVDNSSILVAYLKENKGGTYNTVNYAKQNNKKVIEIK